VTSSVQTTRRFPSYRVAILTCVLLITALAWAYLIHLDRGMSSVESQTVMVRMGMVMNTPWNARDVFFTFTMWSVMMVGMMSPAAAPVLLIYARTRAGRAQDAVSPTVLSFALGYLTVWLGFSVCAALAQFALHQAALLSPTMTVLKPQLAGAILIGAGLYQLTPLKGACLAHCQSPLGFLIGHWRDGKVGAYEMGLRHGTYCLGCCWAIMCVLFAVGVMNLAWVAVLAAFVLLEKAGPSGAFVSRVGGLLMIGAGLWIGL
jgi:predicted metal-binding membrane protein